MGLRSLCPPPHAALSPAPGAAAVGEVPGQIPGQAPQRADGGLRQAGAVPACECPHPNPCQPQPPCGHWLRPPRQKPLPPPHPCVGIPPILAPGSAHHHIGLCRLHPRVAKAPPTTIFGYICSSPMCQAPPSTFFWVHQPTHYLIWVNRPHLHMIQALPTSLFGTCAPPTTLYGYVAPTPLCTSSAYRLICIHRLHPPLHCSQQLRPRGRCSSHHPDL